MPELKNYRLLISHSWKYSTQYDTIVNWLNLASNFKWSNHSVSADDPFMNNLGLIEPSVRHG